jgi:hypothetical protein
MCNRAAGDPLTKVIPMLMTPVVGFSRWGTGLPMTHEVLSDEEQAAVEPLA